MNSITEKHTEKNHIMSMSSEFNPKTDKASKNKFAHSKNDPTDDLAPELLEAHIIALLRNALS